MKNLLNVLFILLFISSCSDTDNSTFPEINDEEENNTEKIIPLKLEIEDTRKNIFDYAVFGLFPNDYFIMFSLFDIYDSITWKVSNLDGKYSNIQKVAPISYVNGLILFIARENTKRMCQDTKTKK